MVHLSIGLQCAIGYSQTPVKVNLSGGCLEQTIVSNARRMDRPLRAKLIFVDNA